MQERAYECELSYTKTVALTLQPYSYSDFNQHPEFEEIFRRWTQRDTYRGLDFVRIWALAMNCKRTCESGDGSIAELGVFQGQSAALLSLYAERFSRKIYLCDTFSGFSEQQFEEGMSDAQKVAFNDNSLEAAQTVVGTYPGAKWVVGTFPDSITEEMRGDRFAFVSIDCDIYMPVYEGLKFFWPRMQAGGMIFIHDYASGCWPGATQAVDEFCAGSSLSGCVLPDLAGTFVVTRDRQ